MTAVGTRDMDTTYAAGRMLGSWAGPRRPDGRSSCPRLRLHPPRPTVRADIVNRTTRLAAVGAGAGLVAGVATGVLAGSP